MSEANTGQARITGPQSRALIGSFSVDTPWEEIEADVQPFIQLTPKERGERFASFLRDGCRVQVVAQAAKEQLPPQPTLLPIPADNEEFELTLDGDAADPIGMVRSDGCQNHERWRFNGLRVEGKQTGTFKLVRAGGVNLAAAKAKLPNPMAEGQWREAFKAKYPQHDGKGPVGFGGSEWVNPRGFARFPFVSDDGSSKFGWAGFSLSGDWRWLVRVKQLSG